MLSCLQLEEHLHIFYQIPYMVNLTSICYQKVKDLYLLRSINKIIKICWDKR